jgi:hypothetical protein
MHPLVQEWPQKSMCLPYLDDKTYCKCNISMNLKVSQRCDAAVWTRGNHVWKYC